MNGFLKAMEEGKEFDWIANHGYELRKEELIDIIKELLYAIHSAGIFDGKEDILQAAYMELFDLYEEEEDKIWK